MVRIYTHLLTVIDLGEAVVASKSGLAARSCGGGVDECQHKAEDNGRTKSEHGGVF